MLIAGIYHVTWRIRRGCDKNTSRLIQPVGVAPALTPARRQDNTGAKPHPVSNQKAPNIRREAFPQHYPQPPQSALFTATPLLRHDRCNCSSTSIAWTRDSPPHPFSSCYSFAVDTPGCFPPCLEGAPFSRLSPPFRSNSHDVMPRSPSHLIRWSPCLLYRRQ